MADKSLYKQSYGFSSSHLQMWELEHKEAECWRTEVFTLWCWSRLLRVPYSARRSNQLILKEIDHECSLEGLMLKLKLQYFGHLIQRANLLEKTLMLGKIESKRRGLQMMRWLDRITNSMEFEQSVSNVRETVEDRGAWCATAHRVPERTRLSDWRQVHTDPQGEITPLTLLCYSVSTFISYTVFQVYTCNPHSLKSNCMLYSELQINHNLFNISWQKLKLSLVFLQSQTEP